MEVVAAIITIGFAVLGAALLALRVSGNEVARLVVGVVLVVVAVAALVVVFDSDTNTVGASVPVVARTAVNPTDPGWAGIAGNGNCPPECLAARNAHRIGQTATRYMVTR